MSRAAAPRAGTAAKAALRLAISAGILAALLWRFGARGVVEPLLHARPGFLAAALAVYVASQLLSARRWQKLARAVGFDVAYDRCARVYAIGMFFGLAIPSTIGADAARALLLGRTPPGRAVALSSVLFDRMVGLVMLVAVAVAALVLGPGDRLPRGLHAAIVGIGSALVALWLVAPAASRLLPAGSRPRRLVAEDLAPYFRSHALVAGAAARSLGVHGLQIASQALVARALGLHLPLGFVALYHPLVTLAAAVPLTVGGFGLREAAYAWLLPHAGVPADDAVALGLLWWAVGASAALLGGVVYLLSPEERVVRRGAPG